MRKTIRASVLVLALAIPAFAGDIPNNVTGYIPNGVTSTGNIPNGATSTGEIPNGVAGNIPNNVTGEIPFGATGNIPYGDTLQTTLLDALLSLFSLI